jgi:membrane protein DedA with SNARE-associated domain
MTDGFLYALGVGGVPVLMLATFLSCLAVPIPASLLMLAAGALASSEDLSLPAVMIGALMGAVLGDQIGYQIGHSGMRLATRRIKPRSRAAITLKRAEVYIQARGGIAVFLSRWLLSPLGPYVNFAAGVSQLPRRVFTLSAIAGEIIWVGLYVGLGYLFGSQIDMLAQLSSNIVGLLAALAVMAGAGIWMRRALRRARVAGDRDALPN